MIFEYIICVQAVHVKCMPFYGNVAHERRTTHLSRLYGQVSVTCVLEVFSEGTVSGPVDVISVFSFGPHILKQVKGYYIHFIFYDLSKVLQSGSQ